MTGNILEDDLTTLETKTNKRCQNPFCCGVVRSSVFYPLCQQEPHLFLRHFTSVSHRNIEAPTSFDGWGGGGENPFLRSFLFPVSRSDGHKKIYLQSNLSSLS